MFKKIDEKELKELEAEIGVAWQELFYNRPAGRLLVLDLPIARDLIDKAKKHKQLRPKLNQLLDDLNPNVRNSLKR